MAIDDSAGVGRRILVGGISGAGKSTLARRLAAMLALPYVEVDALFHGAGWQPRPEFRADIDAATAQSGWVLDHDYAAVADLVWSRMDTFVWLDYSRAVCEWRVLRRSVARGLLRRPLWNGNRESLWRAVIDPEHPARWTWTQHGIRRASYAERVAAMDGLHVVQLRRPREARRWLHSIAR